MGRGLLTLLSLQEIVEKDDDLWEFDTFRRNTLMNIPNEEEDMDLPNSIDTASIALTVRPAPTRLPTSLRGLFDDDIASNDTFKPILPPPPTSATPTFVPPVVPLSSSPSREFVGTKKLGLSEGADDVQLTKYNEFSFPSHQPRYSQDTTPSPAPRLPPTSPPSATRARSTNAAEANSSPVDSPSGISLVRKPSLIRQASVAVMESTLVSPLMPPVRPFAVRDRSGSSSSKGSDGANSTKNLVLPGLKDAVKVKTIMFLLCQPFIDPARSLLSINRECPTYSPHPHRRSLLNITPASLRPLPSARITWVSVEMQMRQQYHFPAREAARRHALTGGVNLVLQNSLMLRRFH